MSQINDSQAYDVFISYSSEEEKQAVALCEVLEANGVKCWFAPSAIGASKKFNKEIPAAIRNTSALVLLWSFNSDKSQYVQSEVQIACEDNKDIFPIRIENVPIKGAEMEIWLKRPQAINAYEGDFDNHLKHIVDKIKADLPPRGAVTPVQTLVVEPEEAPSPEIVKETQAASERLVQSGRVPFEQVWQALVKKVKGNGKWILPGLGWSEYRVSFTPKGSARGENVGGAGTFYSAPKPTVEQVWVALHQDVNVTNSVIRDIIGKSAHTGFIGAIVEELRRLEAEIQPGAPPQITPTSQGSTPLAPEPRAPTTFERVWKKFAGQVRADPQWLLPRLNSNPFRVSFVSDAEVRGGIVGFHGDELPLEASQSTLEKVWPRLKPGTRAVDTVREIIGADTHTNFIGAILEELRRLETALEPDEPEELGPDNTPVVGALTLTEAMAHKGSWRQSKVFAAIRAGATDVDAADAQGFTALHFIARADLNKAPAELMQQVLAHGPELNARDNKGRTPLHIAVESYNLSKARLLLLRGADPNVLDKDGWSARAIAHDDKDMTHLLQLFVDRSDEKADEALNAVFFKTSYKWDKILDAIAAGATQVHLRDNKGATLLHWAVDGGEPELVRLLLDKGADLEATDKYGATPLNIAQKNGYTDIEAILLERAAKSRSK